MVQNVLRVVNAVQEREASQLERFNLRRKISKDCCYHGSQTRICASLSKLFNEHPDLCSDRVRNKLLSAGTWNQYLQPGAVRSRIDLENILKSMKLNLSDRTMTRVLNALKKEKKESVDFDVDNISRIEDLRPSIRKTFKNSRFGVRQESGNKKKTSTSALNLHKTGLSILNEYLLKHLSLFVENLKATKRGCSTLNVRHVESALRLTFNNDLSGEIIRSTREKLEIEHEDHQSNFVKALKSVPASRGRVVRNAGAKKGAIGKVSKIAVGKKKNCYVS